MTTSPVTAEPEAGRAEPAAPPAGSAAGPTDDHGRRLLLLAGGIRLAWIMHTLCELEVADRIAAAPATAARLAGEVGADPDALYRLLRAAAAVGVFTEGDDGRFAMTPLAEGLRTGVPGSIAPLIRYNGIETLWRPYAELGHSVRTGEPAVERALGRPLWDHLAAYPEVGAAFDEVMSRMSGRLIEQQLDVIAPGRFTHLVDVGGGNGRFLAAAVRRMPGGGGTLFERESVLDGARALLAEQGLAERITLRAGSFLDDPVPVEGDAYLLRGVLHNWGDREAAAILRGVRRAVGDRDVPLFLFEQVVSGRDVWDHAKLLDVDMLVIFGGRERTLADWGALLSATGFELVSRPDPGRWTVLTCRPAEQGGTP